MRGVVFKGNREAEVRQFPDPEAGPGEAVVKIRASGLCGSDLHRYRGAEPTEMITGHEPCGVIAELGPGAPDGLSVDDRVMVHHYHGCGLCRHCRTGWAQLCQEGMVVYGATAHGGHAPYLKVPASTLVPLPESLPFATGAAISCGTGTAYGALQRIGLSGRDTIAVFGQGPVGLSAVQLAKAMGARVLAIDINPERRALAKDFGADAVIDPAADDPVEAIRELTEGELLDVALDCSGASEARLAAVKSTRTWGTVCFVGEGGTVTLDVSQDLIRRQLTIVASWTFSSIGQADCARFIVERKIPVENLFTQRYSLDQAVEAYTLFDTQSTGKGVFVF